MRFASAVFATLLVVKLKRNLWLARYFRVSYARVPFDPEARQQLLAQLTVLWATQPPGLHTGDTEDEQDPDEFDDLF